MDLSIHISNLEERRKNMTSPAKFKKDKEIIAEYDTQVKGKLLEK